MAYVVKDRVQVTTNTTGTGSITLESAFSSFQSFSSIGNGNTTYYCIANANAWEIGVGTYNSSGNTLSRTNVVDSSNGGQLVNWGYGPKNVYVTFPSESTNGSMPEITNTSQFLIESEQIERNLIAWDSFKNMINNLEFIGAPYGNGVINGIVSTYPLVQSGGAKGGVLDMEGNVHFVPNSSVIGQKVSLYGQVSTYNLASTTGYPYSGGVLTSAPSGISYVNYPSYSGAVISPEGFVYFVPHDASVGYGTVVGSTYSLAYTTVGAYEGGVLAPNGEVYFIPYNAVVGQKLSNKYVASTYSLVATFSNAYSGGVIDSEGSIHFVPYAATVGQKVSKDGVVSTYSLVYSAGGVNKYSGGVLAPNGDIHFVPYSAVVGQKISASGVVSTYQLPYTTTNAYSGGVLAPNGQIHFVPFSATVGQKIITNTNVSLGYCLSAFFNKF